MFRQLTFVICSAVGFAFSSIGKGNRTPLFSCSSEQGAGDPIKITWEGMTPSEVSYEELGRSVILSGEALDYSFVSERQIILYLFPYAVDNPVFFNAIITETGTYAGKLFLGPKEVGILCKVT